ncbi:MAG: flagellar biosynthesis anti-sigma factor FlgM [Pseudomonadota bacterium]|jgi:flagellar biosynthesis anti-sigma factor FlgM|uniref:Negative regulator of flagellin synthesis n=1 Tax=Thalassococcus halodurans TaxID=373675 RepID=A0A1H5S1V8_9RHOB|nr:MULTISPECIES: flagellar biosynthesis anti-sigma factor FlgM [Thalassococcus]MBO6867910.1 flagellar biosynthesis anti-sigma factor FlgM [Thalassococcus sp.]MEC8579836.1 flagellar biosynthesis anti-sigma factor FlgM [Pseudomonadota bacterium]SEF43817.1 anti-sigma-28 factor, FlgM family [Thalassococcus halodurans]
MVDSINTSLSARARLQQVKADATDRAGISPAGAGAGSVLPAGDADSVTLSQAASLQVGETLAAKGPPFDLELVAKIKEAIEAGRYPVDAQAITDSLFEGYTDMIS